MFRSRIDVLKAEEIPKEDGVQQDIENQSPEVIEGEEVKEQVTVEVRKDFVVNVDMVKIIRPDKLKNLKVDIPKQS